MQTVIPTNSAYIVADTLRNVPMTKRAHTYRPALTEEAYARPVLRGLSD